MFQSERWYSSFQKQESRISYKTVFSPIIFKRCWSLRQCCPWLNYRVPKCLTQTPAISLVDAFSPKKWEWDKISPSLIFPSHSTMQNTAAIKSVRNILWRITTHCYSCHVTRSVIHSLNWPQSAPLGIESREDSNRSVPRPSPRMNLNLMPFIKLQSYIKMAKPCYSCLSIGQCKQTKIWASSAQDSACR